MGSDAGCAPYNGFPPYTSACAALFRVFARAVLWPAIGPAIRVAARIWPNSSGALHRYGKADPAILVDQIATCRARLGPRQAQAESRSKEARAQSTRGRFGPRREDIVFGHQVLGNIASEANDTMLAGKFRSQHLTRR